METSPTSGATTVSVEQFLKHLADSGLLPAAEVQRLAARVPPEQRADCRPLVQELVRLQKLTKYQAQMLYQGKVKGLILGSYVILDKLGQGGMGVVFQARHQRMGRVVALKVLPPTVIKNPGAVQRFQREAQAAAKLHHPNIVAAYDAGEDKGVHFLVMEFVDGTDLAQRVKQQGALPLSQALDCVLQAARGLEAAHAAGIVHRDIKPHNLLLDSKGTVKVLDMGLARFEGGSNSPSEAGAAADELTASGSIMGTTDYMAPEQALNTKRADARADIYSLGCTFYYLLAGRAIYGGETAMEKLVAHRETPIPPLPNAPAAVDSVYRRMVAKKSESRYQSMREVLADLERCQGVQGELPASADAPVPSPLSGQEETQAETRRLTGLERTPAARPLRRLGCLVGGAAVVLTVIVAAVVVLDRRSKHKAPATTVAAAPTTPTMSNPDPVRVDDPARWEKAVNLLPLIDPAKDAIFGRWQLTKEGLSPDGTELATVEIPYRPPEEYDFRIAYVRQSGKSGIQQNLCKSERRFAWQMGTYGNTIFGLSQVAGKAANANATTVQRANCLENGRKYTSIVQVRGNNLRAYLNGEMLANYQTDYTEMGWQPDWKARNADVLGLLTFQSSFLITEIAVLEVSGEGEFTRPDDPAAKTAARKRAEQTATAALPPELQAVVNELRQRNPGMGSKVSFTMAGSTVVGLGIVTDHLKDATPVARLTGLRSLTIIGRPPVQQMGQLRDLAPLKDLKLAVLTIARNPVSDLAPLRNMPLKRLTAYTTNISDLTPLEGKSLEFLQLNGAPVRDLAPLRTMPQLTELHISKTKVSDLAPLTGLPIRHLDCAGALVTDLAPLKNLPQLVELTCDFVYERDEKILRSLKTLQRINGKTQSDFWKSVTPK